jgi:anthranilate/para-aminobenzoate synthase component I
MIVDLVRNDLGRVCEIGTVVVPRLLQLAPAPGLWHLVSLVEGRLREGVADAELLAATFPPGSVSGAPKVAAVEVIENLEQWPRLSYTGAYGLVGPLVGLQLAVTIRSLEIAADGAAWLGVGGGVTAGSDPRQEWEECLLKAGPIIAACGGDLSRNA